MVSAVFQGIRQSLLPTEEKLIFNANGYQPRLGKVLQPFGDYHIERSTLLGKVMAVAIATFKIIGNLFILPFALVYSLGAKAVTSVKAMFSNPPPASGKKSRAPP